MAKGKRHQHRYPTTRTGGQSAVKETIGPVDLGARDYILLNVLFYAFCLIQLLLVKIILPDMLGVYFFFGFLMVAFAVVSTLDYLAMRMATTAQGIKDAD